MDEHKREQIALFRYGMILPFLSQEKLEWGVKGEMLHHLAAQHREVPHSTKHSVDEETIRKWLAAYHEKGFDGLKPKSRCDVGQRRSISPQAWDMAVQLKKEAPARGVKKIIRIMEANGMVTPGEIKRSTLARHFKQHGLDRKTLIQSHTVHRRFECQRPNQLWQSDILYGPYLPHPNDPLRTKRTYLVAFIDDFSRLLPHAEFYWDEKYPTVEYTLKKGILKRGIPEAIYVDHGQVYSTRKLDAICAALGIRKLQCQPYRPQSKGKIERFFRTVREDFLSEPEIKALATLAELNKLFWAWLETHYHLSDNATTKQSPHQRWRDNIGPYFRSVDEKELIEIFLYQKSRTVNKAGIVSLEGVEFEVDARLKNKRVDIRYNPFDRSWVQIYYNGQFIQKAKPFVIKRWATKDKPTPPTGAAQPSTGIKPLSQLAEKHHDHQKQQAARLTGHIATGNQQFFTLADWVQFLAKSLGKTSDAFHAREIEAIKTFLQTYPQITADCAGVALGQTILKQGAKQHITVYLDAIKQLYMKRQHHHN
ncbi:MAG: DDE-type integrase/transposase/recombinase [Candidatus Aminicenantes bacterium]|nr:DDE-type integrase/transposase/recombinase [Candidatus Aminicenantes bacterium]